MRTLLAIAIAIAFAAPPAAAAAASYPFDYQRVRVAEGIYLFTESFGHAIVSGNSVAIVGDAGVVVVDSGQHPRLTQRIIGEVRALTPKPVLYVVNTHWHNDHVAGNSLYADAFPGVKFVAHQFTAETTQVEGPKYQGANCQKFLGTQTKPLREALATGVAPDGTALAGARRKRYEDVLVEADAAAEECLEFRFQGIDIAFQDRLTLRLGNRDVQVLYLGRANTAGDALVYVPDARVLATGDILVHPFPFATQSYIGEWAAVLRRVEAMDTAAIIPGHGPVMRDKDYLRSVAELMESIDRQVRAAYAPGMKLEELKPKVDVAQLRKRIAGDDPTLGVNFDAMAASAVGRAWQQATGHMEAEGLPSL